ncbi:MAG: nucleotide pyrophosphohydrolase [Chloroflexota bacterium]|nr:nucleotide pyrophosphohydrolase [Chloroflexota bacterium]
MNQSSEVSDKKTSIGQLKQMVQSFVDERDWGKYHNAKDLAISIAIEAAELMEIFQWVREKQIENVTKDAEKRSRIEEEVADVMILCLNLANTLDINAAQAITRKLEKNRAKYPVELVKGDYRKYTELKDNKSG